MNILMCDTQFTFLQYFLLMPLEKFKNTLFIFDNCFSPLIVRNLEKAGLACYQKTLYGMTPNEFVTAMEANRDFLENLIAEFYDYYNGDLRIYGQDHINIAQILWRERLRSIPFTLLDDGLGSYAKKSSLQHGPDAFLRPDETVMGHNSRVNEIYLTGIWRIPADLMRKVKLLDIRYSWENKSNEEKQFFLDIYNLNQPILDIISTKTVCYLGAPLSAFGMMSVEREISLCRKIISGFNPSALYIKPHPTGFNIDYGSEFPEATILMSHIPFEIIYLLTGKNLKTIASISSSATLFVNEDVEKLLYDFEGNPLKLKYPYDDLV